MTLPFSLLTAKPSASGPPATFDPTDHFTCLELWLGSDGHGLVGGEVDTWESGGSENSTLTAETSTQRPDPDTIGGKDSTLFTGANNDHLEDVSASNYFAGDDVEVYLATLLQWAAPAASQDVFVYYNRFNSLMFQLQAKNAFSPFKFRLTVRHSDNGTSTVDFGDASITTPMLLEMWVTAGGVLKARQNGGTLATTSSNVNGLKTGDTERIIMGNAHSGTAYSGEFGFLCTRVGYPGDSAASAMRDAAYPFYGFSGS